MLANFLIPPACANLILCSSANADVFKISDKVGRIKPGLFADILVVAGDPSKNIHDIRNIKLVMKNGVIYVQ